MNRPCPDINWNFSPDPRSGAVFSTSPSNYSDLNYYKDINNLKIKEEMTKLGITTTARQSRLRKLINAQPVVKILAIALLAD